MFPEWTRLDIRDECNSGEIHVSLLLRVDDGWVGDGLWGWCIRDGSFRGKRVLNGGDGGAKLRGTKDVRQKGVVVESPDPMGARGFEVVGFDEAADEL